MQDGLLVAPKYIAPSEMGFKKRFSLLNLMGRQKPLIEGSLEGTQILSHGGV